MPIPPAYRKTAYTHRIGTRANQPLASDVLNGTLYYVNDEGVLERSNGVSWQAYSTTVIGPSTSEFTITTTGNVDNLDFNDADLIRVNNASATTIRGLKAGVAGQKVTIAAVGSAHVYTAHQNTNSTAANRLVNFLTSNTTPLAAGAGIATYQYDATTQRWRLISHDQGIQITVPFNSSHFVGADGTWTVESGDVETIGYFVVGRLVQFSFMINNTSISGSPTQVRISNAQYGGYIVAKFGYTRYQLFDNSAGTQTIANIRIVPSDAFIRIEGPAETSFQNSTNNTTLRAFMFIPCE